ncbi:large conductance mechanosensitive channel protein MscL [Faecalitalea cylindroides]|jgi:large conductance mechanosensitive channel|uniref:large conductance mechanosensitive channel protein MscL n=1 Tax=Faecalitalea cylindroides TaxID=39483 RepID=UPI0022E1BDA0|nr:large conductance mechanosensitive channel protein MscL [Faecalitalea cylindroides]
MKKFIEEFKAFALRGNVMDMAVGVLIGSAFTGIVTALTTNCIQPILDVITGAKVYTIQEVAGFANAFVTAVINFFITALVLFVLLKAINKLMSINLIKKKEEEAETPTVKVCPFCKSEIDIEATRCPHCTSHLEEVME